MIQIWTVARSTEEQLSLIAVLEWLKLLLSCFARVWHTFSIPISETWSTVGPHSFYMRLSIRTVMFNLPRKAALPL
jgi:hypothetical protein